VKWTVLFFCLFVVFLALFVRESLKKPDVAFKPDTSPPISNQLQNPDAQTDDTKNKWLHEVIQRETKYDSKTGILKTRAFTSWTESIFTDTLAAPAPKWLVQADVYAGIVDKKMFYMYGASVHHFINSRAFIGGGAAGSSYGAMLKASAGFVLY
jgi:hypothetical protein